MEVLRKLDEVLVEAEPEERMFGRGLHLFPFQLNMSSSVHRITQLNS